MSFSNATASQSTNNGPTQIEISRVQFSHITQVRFVPGLHEISNDEIKATWLTEEDITNIQRANLKTIKRMRRGKIDEENDCTRGLEYMKTTSHSEQRKQNKASVLNAVLAEQRRQRKSESYDAIKIRNISLIHSRRASDAALRLGLFDDDAASAQLKRLPSKVCDEVNITSEEIQSCSVAQSIKSTLASAAATTFSPPLLQRLTGNLSQHTSPDSKAQLYTFAEAQQSVLYKRSNNRGKSCSRAPKRATAA